MAMTKLCVSPSLSQRPFFGCVVIAVFASRYREGPWTRLNDGPYKFVQHQAKFFVIAMGGADYKVFIDCLKVAHGANPTMWLFLPSWPSTKGAQKHDRPKGSCRFSSMALNNNVPFRPLLTPNQSIQGFMFWITSPSSVT